ncbi:MAG: S1 RNA-binding domain-containing protein [Oscillospiraceae bacterium]|nr:S1 RNA-binding domain-containing protein [Oscillospiraceae bacterium]
MGLEVGDILDGKVTGVTKFGVFVGLPDGKTGMVHISEIAGTYVKEIRDFVTEGQEVKVMVMVVGDDGKIGLSIRRAEEAARRSDRPPRPSRPSGTSSRAASSRAPRGGFDDMLSSFLKSSDDKLSGMKKGGNDRRGGGRRGGGRDDYDDYE